MAALGLILIYIIYFVLGLGCIVFLILTFTSKKTTKIWTFIISVLFASLLFSFKSCQDESYKKNQLTMVGTYNLTKYPNCDSCLLELKEDMTYVVLCKGKIIEKSNWHYEVGGDFFILYLNNDKEQLGSGNYAYDNYNLKYSDNKK